MKKNIIIPLALITTTLSSCSAISGIFKAGFWSGLILVAVIIVVIILLFTGVFKKKQ